MNVAQILAGGTALVRSQPKAIAIWALLYAVVCGALFALMWPTFGALMEAQQQAIAAQAAGQLPVMPPVGSLFATIFTFDGVLLILLVVIFAAAVRAVATGGDDRFGFVRFGGDELRLIGLFFLLLLICIGLFVVVMIIFAILIAVLAMVGGNSSNAEPGGLALVMIAVLYFAMLAAMVWAEVRISLAGAYTVLRGRIVIREAWRATRGRFWTLFGVYFLTFIVYTVMSIAFIAIVYPGLLSAYALAFQGHPEAMTSAVLDQQANMFGPRMIIGMLVGMVIGMIVMAFSFGAIATAAIGFDQADHAAADIVA